MTTNPTGTLALGRSAPKHSALHLSVIVGPTVFSPEYGYGAVGDGVTTLQDVHIQAALDAAAALGGGTVRLGSGTFLLDNPLNVPNDVALLGAGVRATSLKLNPAVWSQFGSSFLVQAKSYGGGVYGARGRVADLTVNGNRSAGGFSTNQGGGISVGDDWTIERVRFTDINFFKLWVFGTSRTRVRNCRWEATAGSTDNIGGGNVTDLLVEDSYFGSDITGSVINLTTATGVVFRDNVVLKNGLIPTGWIDSSIVGNRIATTGAVAIALKGQAAEAGQSQNQLCRNVVVADNDITGDATVAQGIALSYTNSSFDGAHTFPGGGNIIRGNRIRNINNAGILVYGGYSAGSGEVATKNKGDLIIGNVIENILAGSGTFGTGFGTCSNAGIVDMYGDGDIIADNHVADDHAVATTPIGISLGATSIGGGSQTLANADVHDNTRKNITGVGLEIRGSSSQVLSSCRVVNNAGYNPVGLVTVAVPATTVAVAAVQYDRTFYITAGASTCACAVTNADGTSQTVATIPSGGFGAVRVPAGSTMTPTYASAPTWTVQGL